MVLIWSKEKVKGIRSGRKITTQQRAFSFVFLVLLCQDKRTEKKETEQSTCNEHCFKGRLGGLVNWVFIYLCSDSETRTLN